MSTELNETAFNQCAWIMTRGINKGKQCSRQTKNEFCCQHKKETLENDRKMIRKKRVSVDKDEWIKTLSKAEKKQNIVDVDECVNKANESSSNEISDDDTSQSEENEDTSNKEMNGLKKDNAESFGLAQIEQNDQQSDEEKASSEFKGLSHIEHKIKDKSEKKEIKNNSALTPIESSIKPKSQIVEKLRNLSDKKEQKNKRKNTKKRKIQPVIVNNYIQQDGGGLKLKKLKEKERKDTDIIFGIKTQETEIDLMKQLRDAYKF